MAQTSSGFSQFGSSVAQTSSGKQEEQSSSADLNPYINKKARQIPETWQTVQGLGLLYQKNRSRMFNNSLANEAAAQGQQISLLRFDKQGEILTAGYNYGNLVLFHFKPEGGELLREQRD